MDVVPGRHYMVPCVPIQGWRENPPLHRQRFNQHQIWVPVLLPGHADPEIGAPRYHWHVDYRFMTIALINHVFRGPLRLNNIKVVGDPEQKLTPRLRRLRCVRTFGLIHQHNQIEGSIGSIDLHDFEAHWAEARVDLRDGCRYCPHKGTCLEGAAPVVRKVSSPSGTAEEIVPGVVECPGHGLAWDMVTGRLYRRAVPDLIALTEEWRSAKNRTASI